MARCSCFVLKLKVLVLIILPQAWQACNSMWRLWKCPTLSQDCKRALFRATVGNVLLYNAETWTTRRALERRIDSVYTRLLRKALDVPWQLHMTNKELYGIIPSAMDQLRQRPLSFAGHCYRCEDQPVKHLVLWESKTGKMRRDKATASHTSNNFCVILAAQLSTNFNRR